MGDINVTAHRLQLDDWLATETNTYTQNLVTFLTYLDKSTKTLVTTPDAIYTSLSIQHQICVYNSHVIYSDRIRIDATLVSPFPALISQPDTSDSKRVESWFDFSSLDSSAAWANLPDYPTLVEVLNTFRGIKESCRKQKHHHHDKYLELASQQPATTPEQANASLDAEWARFAGSCNASKNLNTRFFSSPNSVKQNFLY